MICWIRWAWLRASMTLPPISSPTLATTPEDVALGGVGVGTAHEIGRGQGVEVGDVAVDVVGVVVHVAQLVGQRARPGRRSSRRPPWRWPCGGWPDTRRRCGSRCAAAPRWAAPPRSARSPAVRGSGSSSPRPRPSSSRKIWILPWPSRRVMGSMVISRDIITDSLCCAAGWRPAVRTGRRNP